VPLVVRLEGDFCIFHVLIYLFPRSSDQQNMKNEI
jgi:hypothetical protein